MNEFVHLHLHTEYSLLDSTIKLESLFTKVRALDMRACAITDSGNMFGAAKFYFTARDQGIKPIIGSEMFVAQGSRFDQRTKGKRPQPHHLVLIAHNDTGYRNLMKLSSLSHLEGYYYGPRIDKELLAEHSEGLLCLTGCLNGEIPRLIRRGSKKDLYTAVEEYLDIFGDRLYLELQDNGYRRQKEINERLMKLSKHFGVPIVATNNCHYLQKNEKEAYETLIAIRRGKRLDKTSFVRAITENLHLRSAQEMGQIFSNYPEALKNTLRIAEMSDVTIDTEACHFPHPPVPAGRGVDEYFVDFAQRGFDERLPMIRSTYPSFDGDLNQKYTERLSYELSVLQTTGFHRHLLVVADYVNWAKANGIPVGPGRGPVSGSLIAYCLGITEIDPIKHHLMFERFLDPERITVPDIDVDLCMKRRDEVIRYITEKYGKNRVAHIITFGNRPARAAIRDSAKALGVSHKKVDEIVRLIPYTRQGIAGALKEEPRLRDLYRREKRVRHLLDNARMLEGIIHHTSTHAAGIIISDSDLADRVPLYSDCHDNTVTQYDIRMLQKIGFIKFDLLGLETLTMIHDATRLLADEGVYIDISGIPLDDGKTYDLLSSGDTSGVFLLEARGLRDALVKLKPSRFSDIMALIALYRPGPMGAGMLDEFVNRKKDISWTEHALPALARTLDDTHGIIVYQEQMMEIAMTVAGFSISDADELRRALAKKHPDQVERCRKRFLAGAIAADTPEKVANEIFTAVESFGEYRYSKAHAASYGLIAYRTAYLKANHYRHYMTILLAYSSYFKDTTKLLAAECGGRGVDVLPRYDFTLKETT